MQCSKRSVTACLPEDKEADREWATADVQTGAQTQLVSEETTSFSGQVSLRQLNAGSFISTDLILPCWQSFAKLGHLCAANFPKNQSASAKAQKSLVRRFSWDGK